MKKRFYLPFTKKTCKLRRKRASYAKHLEKNLIHVIVTNGSRTYPTREIVVTFPNYLKYVFGKG